MAIIRTFDNNENNLRYVGTLSFLCAISCTIIMLKFRRFKANFNISKIKDNKLQHYDASPGVSLTGAYRINKDELFGSTYYPNPPKKITPSMVSLPAAQSGHRKDISKSTNNLAQPLNDNVNKTKSTPNIPEVVPEPLTKTQIKEQKKLEKKHLDEQKKQAKLAAKEQEKEREKTEQLKKENEKTEQLKKEREKREKLKKEKEKTEQLRKEREKTEQLRKEGEKTEQLRKEKDKAEHLRKEREKTEQLRKEREKTEQLTREREKQMQKTKAEEKKKSKRAPQPQPQAENVEARPENTTRLERPESTNTLESSISRSSGPPPYSPQEDITIINNNSDTSGNISFSDQSSWSMISQHRLEINRPVVVKSIPKQTHLDLHYNVGPTNATDNTDA